MERSPGREISECTGRNVSEHRASLEKGNADADLLEIQGRLVGRREQAEDPSPSAGVVVMACAQRGRDATREVRPEGWEPTGSPRGTGPVGTDGG
jgi:hypothetical protein